MRLLANENPIDYDRLCRQTVTVYHQEGSAYTRTVYRKAFLDHKKTLSVDKIGSHEGNSFLLVIPGASQAVFINDKVYEGVGPEIDSSELWRAFTPVTTPGLVVVKYADPKKWNGRIVHTEAGG